MNQTFSKHLESFIPAGQEDLLFQSENQGGEGRFGRRHFGVPVCWPWFGANYVHDDYPAHGLARYFRWDFIEAGRFKNGDVKIAVLDLGVKLNILRNFAKRGASMRVFPMNTSLEEMMEWNPDGLFVTNGPGDPAAMMDTVKVVKQMIDSGLPVFGICMGHQLIAQAMGLSTYKMFNGHRGINHPVKNLITGKGEITTQNHGFAVDDATLPECLEITHKSLFDGSLQGMKRTDIPAFSFQGHPEASPGPHDVAYLFDQFIDMMKSHKK